jgi:hypothetical protein
MTGLPFLLDTKEPLIYSRMRRDRAGVNQWFPNR